VIASDIQALHNQERDLFLAASKKGGLVDALKDVLPTKP